MPVVQTRADFCVLLCEDDPGIRGLITLILTRAGMTAQIATDGEAALARIVSLQPDLILLDLMMPKLSGLEVIDWLKEHRPELLPRIVVITAAGNSTLKELDGQPICAIIRKPFDTKEFQTLLMGYRDRVLASLPHPGSRESLAPLSPSE